MTTATEFEATSALTALARRTAAKEVLEQTARPLGMVAASISVACCAGSLALVAMQASGLAPAVVGGTAGAALALGAQAWGEMRRIRRRLDAALSLSRIDAGV